MSDTVAVTMRVDRNLKIQAQELFGELGLDMSTAYNMFLRQAVRTRSIPFEIAIDSHSDDSILVDRKTMDIFVKEYLEARSLVNQDDDWITEEEMLERHGVDL